jgi:hypothetical protein
MKVSSPAYVSTTPPADTSNNLYPTRTTHSSFHTGTRNDSEHHGYLEPTPIINHLMPNDL